MLQNPLISIIVPCYKQAQFLPETLNSILFQSYENWECIIVNDGSPDSTDQIAKLWCEKDFRFKYIEKENGGLSSARNLGLKVAKGDYIQFLDADDLLDKNKFSKSVSIFKKENCDIVLTNFLRFKKSLKKTKRAYCKLENQEFTFKSILLDWDFKFTIPIHCGLFKKELIGDVVFNETLKAKEDWVFWLDIFKSNPNVTLLNEVLVYYRVNPSGMTRDHVYMEKNHNIALGVIFDRLDDKYKKMFFIRLANEVSLVKDKFRVYKEGVFYRKIFYKIKNLLSR